jgi:FdhD protein
MKQGSVKQTMIIRVNSTCALSSLDTLAVEEPLEIRLAYGEHPARIIKNVSVTMRTPGNDRELAVGFLFTEGIISNQSALLGVSHSLITCAGNKENIVQVDLKKSVVPHLQNSERNFYTTSSCGVCGKSSINAIKTIGAYQNGKETLLTIKQETLQELPGNLRLHQDIFETTGGLHACALFNPSGDLLLVREDVGRHNALDKLIGAALEKNLLPLEDHILLLSGRGSFELIQKATMAGIRIVAAVGAPSSLAVQLAEEFGITLIGFLRQQRFNIYTNSQRIIIPAYENQN